MVSTFIAATTNSLQASFLAMLPRIESQARIYFRAIKCTAKKADCIAEVVAISWKWFCNPTDARKVESGTETGLPSMPGPVIPISTVIVTDEPLPETM